MLPVRRLATVTLLAAFLGGGLVAPAVHRAAHGIEHAQASHEAASQTEHVHTDGTGFTVALSGVGPHGLCLLCLPAPHDGPAVAASGTPDWSERRFAPQRPLAPITATRALLPIRGPPAVL